jgi:hypothetical protein
LINGKTKKLEEVRRPENNQFKKYIKDYEE